MRQSGLSNQEASNLRLPHAPERLRQNSDANWAGQPSSADGIEQELAALEDAVLGLLQGLVAQGGDASASSGTGQFNPGLSGLTLDNSGTQPASWLDGGIWGGGSNEGGPASWLPAGWGGGSNQPSGTDPNPGDGTTPPDGTDPTGGDGANPPAATDPNQVQGGGPSSTTGATDTRSLLSPEAQAAYDRLGSKLDNVDAKTGLSLRQILDNAASGSLDPQFAAVNPGKTMGDILSQVVTEIDDPGQIHQDTKGACASTTVEYMAAKNQPATFARLALGLTQGDSVSLADGSNLSKAPGSLGPDDTNRSDIDRVLQSAFTNLVSTDGNYDDTTDAFANGAAGGLTQAAVSSLAQKVLGGSYTTYDASSGNFPTIDQLNAAAAQGPGVPVGLDWTPDYGQANSSQVGHELLFTGYDPTTDQVHLRNPWGAEEDGSVNDGPTRQLADTEGDITMSLAEFQQRLQLASLPNAGTGDPNVAYA